MEFSRDAGAPRHLGELYAQVGARLRTFHREADAAAAISATAVDLIPGAEHAGITRVGSSGMTTIGASAPVVDSIDAIQYRLGSGPCVDAVVHDRPVVAQDLAADDRWPVFGQRAAEQGVRAMMSYRMFLGDDDRDDGTVIGGLNVYAGRVGAFDLDLALPALSALTAYAALAVWGGRMSQHVLDLEAALDSSRDIGVAQGVLMERYKVTREEAFGLLAIASQNGNRKLRDIAADLAATGELPLPTPRTPRRGRPPRQGGNPGSRSRARSGTSRHGPDGHGRNTRASPRSQAALPQDRPHAGPPCCVTALVRTPGPAHAHGVSPASTSSTAGGAAAVRHRTGRRGDGRPGRSAARARRHVPGARTDRRRAARWQ
jgi:hypothetical protein